MRYLMMMLALATVPLSFSAPVMAALERPASEHHRELNGDRKAQQDARRKAWEAMTPEQREAKRKERQERRKNRPQGKRPQQ